jgi:hypothetical protein
VSVLRLSRRGFLCCSPWVGAPSREDFSTSSKGFSRLSQHSRTYGSVGNACTLSVSKADSARVYRLEPWVGDRIERDLGRGAKGCEG